jgi:ectoine hydroxylase-related dioxygenase (phytanoyl-CoA dioxygenase family)
MAGRIFAGLCEVRLTNDERPRALHLLHNSLRSLRALFASVIAVEGAHSLGKALEKGICVFSQAVEGKAGDLVIWNSFLPHGTGPNTSDQPRLAQFITMVPADSTGFEGLEQEGG